MKREIVLLTRAERADAALMEDGLLTEYLPGVSQDVSGMLVKGIIERYVPGMQAAFVDVGMEKNGFLPLAQTLLRAPSAMQSKKAILVQIKKAPSGEKAAYLTEEVSLSGAYLVYQPFSNRVGVSAKITDEKRRGELKALAETLVTGQDGLVMRTAAQMAPDHEIIAEWERLYDRWQGIMQSFEKQSGPCVLDAGNDPVKRLLNDYHGRIDLVTADSDALAARYQGVCYTGEMPLDAVYQISDELKKALGRKVWLSSGGFLIIDPCEAMTVIDVNTGRFTGKRALEDTILKTNLAACTEIARQLRLRNLSGIILIDFIDMQTDEARAQVQKALEDALKLDRKKTELYGFTKLGLMEMTRKKDSPPLWAALKE